MFGALPGLAPILACVVVTVPANELICRTIKPRINTGGLAFIALHVTKGQAGSWIGDQKFGS